jgi:pimeloyl-ACP methyl ester carboxylesterase
MKYFVAQGEDRRLDAASRSGLRGAFVALSDGVTHYELAGPANGDVVVLVGGLTIPLFYWDSVAAMLHAAGLRTLAYSGYGRGYSDRPATRYDDALFIRQVAELIQALGLRGRHHIVGSSMGALTAMGFVSAYPATAATLTISGPAGLASKPAALRWLLVNDWLAGVFAKHFGHRWLEHHEGANLGDRTRVAELSAMIRDAYRYEGSLYALFSTLQSFGLFDRAALYQEIAELPVPTMLIWGRDDQVTPIDKLDTARALLRPVQCHVIECGHMVPFERPEEAVSKILSFMDTNKAWGAS